MMATTSSRSSQFARLGGLVACTLVLGLCLPGRAADQTYKVKLKEADKVGDKFTFSSSGKSKNVTTATPQGGAAQKNEDAFSAKLDGKTEVLAVDKDGAATKVAIT